jgi:hypothetical protein
MLLADDGKMVGSSRRNVTSFSLQFDSAEIRKLSDSYRFEDEAYALKAGKRISQGEYARAHLETIYRWKTRGRGISRLEKNTDEEIADVLALAAKAKTERSAVAVLCGLTGIDIPVASAVLTAMNPERYTVVDFRALESLGVTPRPVLTVGYYLAYLDKCRELAKQHRVSLRVLDRALWQWSKDKAIRKRNGCQ